MATAQALIGEERFLLEGIRWETYEQLLEDVAQRHVRLTYDHGSLEFMTPSGIHEGFKSRIRRLIQSLTLELDIPIRTGGSQTFKRRELESGLEPDECFWIAHEKEVRNKDEVKLPHDPSPDLAVEVEISRALGNRAGVYAALGVPEIWKFGGDTLEVLTLSGQGKYVRRKRSLAFPFLPLEELPRFIRNDAELDETRLIRSFIEWIREQSWAHTKRRPRE